MKRKERKITLKYTEGKTIYFEEATCAYTEQEGNIFPKGNFFPVDRKDDYEDLKDALERLTKTQVKILLNEEQTFTGYLPHYIAVDLPKYFSKDTVVGVIIDNREPRVIVEVKGYTEDDIYELLENI